MSQMPSRVFLEASIRENFSLRDEKNAVADVELLSVSEGIKMNDDHVCYAAVFGLPNGIFAAQGTYQVSHPSGSTWALFLTPVAPDANGRARLEALFHYRIAVNA